MKKLGIWVDYSSKIVCNELRRQELISVSDWVHDASYCASRFSPATYQGYRLWAAPCLRLMRKHRMLARGLAVAVRWMAADIKYRKGLSKRPHLPGRFVSQCLFWPANSLLGTLAGLRRKRTEIATRNASIRRLGC